jgi:hypothetical protein
MTSHLSGAGSALAFALLTTLGCGDSRLPTTSDSAARDSGAADTDGPEADAPRDHTSDVGADADDAGSSSCIGVTGGGLEPWLDVRIVGRRFDAYEGRRLRVVVANGVGDRLGVANVPIAGGGFDLTIPGTFNYGSYAELSLYVDDDADQACDVGEPLWGLVTGAVKSALLVEVTPDGPCLSGGGPSMAVGCRPWRSPVGPCTINGQADLAMRLPCPP